jgi:hypothetical protein
MNENSDEARRKTKYAIYREDGPFMKRVVDLTGQDIEDINYMVLGCVDQNKDGPFHQRNLEVLGIFIKLYKEWSVAK